MSSNNLNQKPGNNSNKSSTIKPGNNSNTPKSNTTGNKNKPTILSTKINNITHNPNGLVNNKTKCNQTLEVNSKPPKSKTNQETNTDNSEGKMACIIS
jgi:hypothetical protein